MPETVWFRSLYWRIAIGFVAMLAVVLVLQTTLFLYMTGRFAASSRTPQQLADEIARDLSDTLTDNPALDLERHVRDRYDDLNQAFVVVLRDGRRAVNRPGVLPPGFGGGPRVCLGKAFAKLQLRAMVRAFVSRQRLEPEPLARPRIR